MIMRADEKRHVVFICLNSTCFVFFLDLSLSHFQLPKRPHSCGQKHLCMGWIGKGGRLLMKEPIPASTSGEDKRPSVRDLQPFYLEQKRTQNFNFNLCDFSHFLALRRPKIQNPNYCSKPSEPRSAWRSLPLALLFVGMR